MSKKMLPLSKSILFQKEEILNLQRIIQNPNNIRPELLLAGVKGAQMSIGDKIWIKESVADVNSEMGPSLLYKADHHLVGWEDFSETFGPNFGAGPSFSYVEYPTIKNYWTPWFTDIVSNEWCPPSKMPRWASRYELIVESISFIDMPKTPRYAVINILSESKKRKLFAWNITCSVKTKF